MIINNVSTAIALDIGIKMLGHSSFTEITQSTKKLCSFDVQFLKAFHKEKILSYPVCPEWELRRRFRK